MNYKCYRSFVVTERTQKLSHRHLTPRCHTQSLSSSDLCSYQRAHRTPNKPWSSHLCQPDLLTPFTVNWGSTWLAELEDPSLRHGSEVNQLLFWKERQAMFPTLKPVAEDLLAAPASQAYVERIFSVCGIMSTGNRNRMSKSLETRVCLKLNNNVLKQSGFQYY